MPLLIGATESEFGDFAVLEDLDVRHWLILGAVVLILLAIDLYRHRDAHEPSFREALAESLFWVACGLGFSIYVLISFNSQAFGEYLSGYLIEKALSVDNVFVWSMLFTSLAIPLRYQHRVLFYGIFGALVLRAIFIFLGSALLQQFEILLLVFGLFLVYTGFRIIRHRDDEGETSSRQGIGLLERFMPVTDEFDGQKFITRIDGRRVATPLLAALVVVEVTDLIFAVDSVPAILGLRAMYFLLAEARERFHYLNHGLGAILIFVGLKMTATRWYHLNVWVSLGIIAVLLLAAVVFSERKNRQLQRERLSV